MLWGGERRVALASLAPQHPEPAGWGKAKYGFFGGFIWFYWLRLLSGISGALVLAGMDSASCKIGETVWSYEIVGHFWSCEIVGTIWSCGIVGNFRSCKTGGFIWSCEIGGREKEADSKVGDWDQHLKPREEEDGDDDESRQPGKQHPGKMKRNGDEKLIHAAG